ncbi:thyrotropin-releasing hormone receptor, partial [Biomphalaria pfeifferi]
IKRKPVGENEFMDVCNFRLARSSYVVLYMIDLIVFYVIPLIIATVLYLLIWRILYLSRAMRKKRQLKGEKIAKEASGFTSPSKP